MSINSIRCSLPFCQTSQGEQASLSLGLRISAIALGIIGVIGGTLVLHGVLWSGFVGSVGGWSCVSFGFLMIGGGVVIKCIKEQSPRVEVGSSSEVNLITTNEEPISIEINQSTTHIESFNQATIGVDSTRIEVHQIIEREVSNDTEFVCPITYEHFITPWILLEDGFTYEKSAIEKWLRCCPTRSPLIGDISSATVLPNCTVRNWDSTDPTTQRCPITLEAFREPYYCVEDGFTYEKEAILHWFETKCRDAIERDYRGGPIYVKSPSIGFEFNSLTLYPNKILFPKEGGLPPTQKPIVFDMQQIISTAQPEIDTTCIYDRTIRRLVSLLKSNSERATIVSKIHQRRRELGLRVTIDEFQYNPDLSHLDLSSMYLEEIYLKGVQLTSTNLSDSDFKNCRFPRCQFIACNMQNTEFKNCDFTGEEVSFFKTDMINAYMKNCCIERGRTWEHLNHSIDAFKQELSRRGAMHADTITVVFSPGRNRNEHSI